MAVIVLVLFLFNYTIEILVMNDMDKGMQSDIKTLKKSIEEGDVNFGREISEIRKDISLIVIDGADEGIYMEGFNLEELAYIKNELSGNDRGIFDISIGGNKKYHIMTIKLPENPLFPQGSSLVLVRDITYISNTSYFSSYLLVVTIFLLFVFFVLLIKFAIEWIFRALRELNDFAIALQGGKNPDLSVRFHKKYGNKEMDTLIMTLNDSIEKMEDSFKSMEEFSSNVSHELKTPITSMKSMIEVELSKERTKREYQETLLRLSEETDWLSGIIRDLLVLTTNPQKIVKAFKPMRVSRLGEEICDIMEIIALDEGVDLSWDFSCIEDELVFCDGNSIKQAIMNLVNNAIKYNRENGWIKVYGESAEGKISIVVEDNGIGIKKENISRLTERFFREDNVRTVKKSGVGLGLSLVKHILQIHKGSLDIYSEDGKGSSFKISLPKYSEG